MVLAQGTIQKLVFILFLLFCCLSLHSFCISISDCRGQRTVLACCFLLHPPPEDEAPSFSRRTLELTHWPKVITPVKILSISLKISVRTVQRVDTSALQLAGKMTHTWFLDFICTGTKLRSWYETLVLVFPPSRASSISQHLVRIWSGVLALHCSEARKNELNTGWERAARRWQHKLQISFQTCLQPI